jgi:hypothetical protein
MRADACGAAWVPGGGRAGSAGTGAALMCATFFCWVHDLRAAVH